MDPFVTKLNIWQWPDAPYEIPMYRSGRRTQTCVYTETRRSSPEDSCTRCAIRIKRQPLNHATPTHTLEGTAAGRLWLHIYRVSRISNAFPNCTANNWMFTAKGGSSFTSCVRCRNPLPQSWADSSSDPIES